jgi:hypothetical protein
MYLTNIYLHSINAINTHYLYRAVYNLSHFQKIGYHAHIFNGVTSFLNSGELEGLISELHAAQNNNFPCYVRINYQTTQCHDTEGNNINTKSRIYTRKKVTTYFGIYKAAF